MLDEFDTFRDDALPPMGIRFEDKMGGGGKSVWKLADAKELMKERGGGEEEGGVELFDAGVIYEEIDSRGGGE